MRYNELTQEEYTAALKVVFIGAEGLHAHAQDVGDGMATYLEKGVTVGHPFPLCEENRKLASPPVCRMPVMRPT